MDENNKFEWPDFLSKGRAAFIILGTFGDYLKKKK